MKKYRIRKKKDTSFGGWGSVVDFMTGEALKEAIEGPYVVEAETPEEAKRKASEKYGYSIEEIEVEEVS